MIKVRSYENENDFVLMQNLIRENYLKSGEQLYPSPADLEYWRYLYDDSPDGVRWTRLWFDDDHLLAFAWMNEEATDFVCHYQHKDLLNQIIDWSESERLKQMKKKIVNVLYIFDCDQKSETIARQKGYQKSEVFNYYGKRDLAEPIPQVKLPEGYFIKNIETEAEIGKRAEMNGLAGNEVTAEKYRFFMAKAANYRQELDLLAVSPSGETAGFCTVWFDSVSKVGLFEPYGVDVNHLRKGIGKSLLSEGMSRLLALGCSAVYVTPVGLDSEEIDPALALNEAVGFKKVANNYLWYKQLK